MTESSPQNCSTVAVAVNTLLVSLMLCFIAACQDMLWIPYGHAQIGACIYDVSTLTKIAYLIFDIWLGSSLPDLDPISDLSSWSTITGNCQSYRVVRLNRSQSLAVILLICGTLWQYGKAMYFFPLGKRSLYPPIDRGIGCMYRESVPTQILSEQDLAYVRCWRRIAPLAYALPTDTVYSHLLQGKTYKYFYMYTMETREINFICYFSNHL